MSGWPVRAFGERCLLVDVTTDGGPLRTARRARALATHFRALAPSADVVVGGASVLVDSGGTPLDREGLARVVASFDPREMPSSEAREHAIDVVYDGDDLAEVAARAGLSIDEAIGLHADHAYEVEVVGFLPGFAYLGEVDPRLVLPRRPSPRKSVPAGAIAIAGRYTGVYPSSSPGGWNLLGHAIDPELFIASREPPARFAPGDTVRFLRRRTDERRARGAPASGSEESASASNAERDATIEILRASPHATVQDLGRVGRRGEGIPRAGAWDLATHVRANRALGNSDADATIECPFDGLTARVLSDAWFSVDGEAPRFARAGGTITVERNERRVRYLAIESGFDVPLVLGSRATLLAASIGGLGGRRLRKGDRLASRRTAPCNQGHIFAPWADLDDTGQLELLPGPDLDRFPEGSLERLVASEMTISTLLDRTGARLEGTRIPRSDDDRGAPSPMIPGAIQIATDGTPIVLGPDAATTGGYPVIAVLTEASQSALSRLRPGRSMRFALG